ncbi:MULTISPECIES: hypothetical protein [unclassified Enterococcus]|uniref:hypothetical protein n=1 Tax=unclassified Enterococcus TaxID=2608891 RepID=UPI001556CC5D|nr:MULTISPECIES: hypothetical protein [unclassified Enterococcus]MBS7578368.1 hypothetical protein [Enterococcus sp. MMGLQ5-2]MBS7585552.1 hypothetical protein [Enterococcus sp. MMGLQ5-1]NPD13411.1 hypothetical protein [Enterococcus sp. MMGLQ5-1]NPD38200.1 hypothetical protein [Enterococcus sp. MMGLQ5-2]
MVSTHIEVNKIIQAPIDDCFNWFYYSDNFVKSLMVFVCKPQFKGKYGIGSRRIVLTVAGLFKEEIVSVKKQQEIHYKVYQSFPKVIQDNNIIYFQAISSKETQINWSIELSVKAGCLSEFLTKVGGKLASELYDSILNASQKELRLASKKF